jgi:hypothetical protein
LEGIVDRSLLKIVFAGAAVLFSGLPMFAQALENPAIAPASAAAGAAQSVVATVRATDSAILGSSINLQRVDNLGRVTEVVGNLRDDGLEGDATAGDRVFSIRFVVFEQAPGTLQFRFSAAVQGRLTRILTPPIPFEVTGQFPVGITINQPTNLAFTNITPIIVSGAAGDPNATVRVNGIQATKGGNSFQASIPLQEGNNTITAVATNSNNTTSTTSLQVTLDTTPPRVTVASPVENFITTEASIPVSGIVNDIVVGTVNEQQAQVTVNGLNAPVANRTFLSPPIPLQLGPNALQVIARDQTGNQSTATVNIVRQAPAERHIRLISGNNQTAVIGSQLPQALVVQLLNGATPVPNTPVVFKVIANDGFLTPGANQPTTIVVNTNAQGRATAQWTIGNRAGSGNNIVEAYSGEFQGTALFTASGTPRTATRINVDSGMNQFGPVGQRLPLPFIAVVTDSGFNRLPNVPVTFIVREGGGSINGQTSVTTNTDSDGRALAVLTLGSQPGQDNNVVEANFAGNPGAPARFTATAKVPGLPENTSISGVVLDNSNIPIPNVTIRLFQTQQGINNNQPVQVGTPVTTNAQGFFRMIPAPVGFFKLMADGTTAGQGLKQYPTLEYDIVTVSGQDNTVGMPIYLPVLDPAAQICVDPQTGGTLTLSKYPGFSLTIAPGSATFPGGSKTGCVSVTPVNPDKVPMVPGFGQQPRFVVTIQPVGTLFNPPAAITIPNVDGLGPNAKTEMYSFDHDLAAFVAIGSGTVSEDGSIIGSDPGVGVLKAGWHCGGNPNQAGAAASLSVSISPQKNVKGVETEFTVTANGSPPQDGTYSWQILATQAGDDASAVTLVQSPSCNNQSSCTATVKGVKGGKATLRVTFRCTTTGATKTADARITIVSVEKIEATISTNVGAPPTMMKDSTTKVPKGALTWPGALWTGTTPIILIRDSLPTVPLKATTIPPANDPDVDVTFEVVRATDDAAGLGAGLPGIAKNGKDAATLSINERGSFQVLAFIDQNGNGKRDNDETGVTLPAILVQATLVQNLSVGRSGNITFTAGANPGISTGTFDIANPANAGAYLAAEVSFVGGGGDGRRGVDRVFGGWVNNETQAEDVRATYENNHTIFSVFATNAASATGNFAGPLFLPGDPAPVIRAAPLLDTGRPAPGTGGDSSTLTRSRIGTTTNLPLGQRKLIETVDSPGQPYPGVHPGFPGRRITQARFNLFFGGFLTLWTNVSGAIGPTGDVADRTYAVILEQPWTISATYNINVATGAGTAVGTPAITMGAPTTRNPVVPVTATSAVMVPPTGLSLLALDGRN